METPWEILRKTFSREDMYALKDAAQAFALLRPEEGLLYRVALLLGIHESFRISELVRLRLENLDLSRKHPKIWVQSPTGTSKRMVTISRDLRDLLVEFIQWKKAATSPSSSQIDYLFTDRFGKQLDAKSLESILSRLVSEAGIKKHT